MVWTTSEDPSYIFHLRRDVSILTLLRVITFLATDINHRMVLTATVSLFVFHPGFCFGPLWDKRYQGVAEEVNLLPVSKYSDNRVGPGWADRSIEAN